MQLANYLKGLVVGPSRLELEEELELKSNLEVQMQVLIEAH